MVMATKLPAVKLVSIEERGQILKEQAGKWSFLTNHARVLIVIARDPASRLRDIAAACHITERTAQSIVKDLEQPATCAASATDGARATSSARTAPSATPQRRTCPSGDCWNSSPLTPASADAPARRPPHHMAISTAHEHGTERPRRVVNASRTTPQTLVQASRKAFRPAGSSDLRSACRTRQAVSSRSRSHSSPMTCVLRSGKWSDSARA